MNPMFKSASVIPTGEKRTLGFLRILEEERYSVALHQSRSGGLPQYLTVWAEDDYQARKKAQAELKRYNEAYAERDARQARKMTVEA